jgi:hypothetical protein
VEIAAGTSYFTGQFARKFSLQPRSLASRKNLEDDWNKFETCGAGVDAPV